MSHSPARQQVLSEHYLKVLYHHSRGHGVNPRQNKIITEKYGEILYPSVNKLLRMLNLTEQDVFYDLGSGLGKVVIQFFLNSKVKQATGIEIIPELHQQAVNAKSKVEADLPGFYLPDRNLSFHQGSFLDISFASATVVLLGSPCFSQQLLRAFSQKLKFARKLHTILSLRALPEIDGFKFKKAIKLECTWDSALGFLYVREF